MLSSLLAVFVGGGAGSVLRYLIGLLLKPWFPFFPAHTLFANILAALMFSWILTHPKFIPLPIRNELLLAGFCGGLSTFSTFSHETFQFIEEKKFALALLNILLNVILCIIIFLFFNERKSV